MYKISDWFTAIRRCVDHLHLTRARNNKVCCFVLKIKQTTLLYLGYFTGEDLIKQAVDGPYNRGLTNLPSYKKKVTGATKLKERKSDMAV